MAIFVRDQLESLNNIDLMVYNKIDFQFCMKAFEEICYIIMKESIAYPKMEHVSEKWSGGGNLSPFLKKKVFLRLPKFLWRTSLIKRF